MQQQVDQIVSLHFSILTKLCASTARARRSGWVFSRADHHNNEPRDVVRA